MMLYTLLDFGSQKLVKYSLDGKELARGGYDLLYPTSITKIDDNRIAVIDANLGIIITYDTNFKELEHKGPLPEEYHRPYGIAHSDGSLIITDTYKSRVVIYNEAEKAITDTVEMLPAVISTGTRLDYGKAPLYQCSSQVVPQVFMELIQSAYKLPRELTARVGYQTFCLLLANDIYSYKRLDSLYQTKFCSQ
ncbi:MAG: hypothetical protein BGO77_06980 [Caedibacter sp. 37-49]|nr:MAG: hypothetical protein BGO77_06980 [Caedibacter sp. 37-49]